MKNKKIKTVKLLFLTALLLFFSISFSIFAKKTTQAVCGLGSGGGVLGTNFKYQVITDYRPFRVVTLSKKTKDANGDYLQQYKRIINLELTSYPTNSEDGSQFAIVSIEDSNVNE